VGGGGCTKGEIVGKERGKGGGREKHFSLGASLPVVLEKMRVVCRKGRGEEEKRKKDGDILPPFRYFRLGKRDGS